jgi:oxygen-independent coproporphyrinogen-3 oxidase
MKMSIGFYIHVPFCNRKCGYCDFYSVTNTALVSGYGEAVLRNIREYEGINADSLYFGGGTPSLLPSETIDKIMKAVNPEPGAEITLECNPQSQSDYENYFRAARSAGVNRLSVGVQSLDDSVLHTLGRLHNRQGALETLKAAKTAGFLNISADLMLGVPGQTETGIIADIRELAALGVKHISAYLLKIEPGTAFSSLDKSLFPDEDRVCDFYLQAVKTLAEYGFEQYEISNFAVPGYESYHNLKYWNCEEYIGIGPSAHSYYNGVRFAVKPDIEAFISSEKQPTYITDENPGGSDERLMLGLRLMKQGVKKSDFPGIDEKASAFVKAGLLEDTGDKYRLTARGALVSNSIIAELT